MDRQHLSCRIEICPGQYSQSNVVWDILRIHTVHTDIRQHRYAWDILTLKRNIRCLCEIPFYLVCCTWRLTKEAHQGAFLSLVSVVQEI